MIKIRLKNILILQCVFALACGIYFAIPWSIETVHATEFSIQTGYFMGTDADDTAITGVGFEPQFLMIKDDTADGDDGMIFKTSAMGSDTDTSSKLGEAEADASDLIQTFDPDGFTVGVDGGTDATQDMNLTNVRYNWIAFAGSDCSGSGNFCVGSYTGNGTSLSITSVGFQPDFVLVKGAGATRGLFKTSDMGANDSAYFSAAAYNTSGTLITSFLSNGFTVGNSADVNTNSTTYWYVAFKDTSEAMTTGTYTGNGADNRDYSVASDFNADFVIVRSGNTSSSYGAVYNVTESYDDYSSFFTDTANAVNYIQKLTTDGFQLGSNAAVNESGVAQYYIAFAGAVDPTPSGTFQMATGTYVGDGAPRSITLGFAPDLVIIKVHASGAAPAIYRTRTMWGDESLSLGTNATGFANGITSLNADGFTIGTNNWVNTNGATYAYQAFGNAFKPQTGAGAADFAIGTYLGNGIDDRRIVKVGFQADAVVVKGVASGAGRLAAFKTSAHTGQTSSYFSTLGDVTTALKQTTATSTGGMLLGTVPSVNTVNIRYNWFAFKEGTNFDVGTYTGTGSAQTISTPFQPDLAWAKRLSTNIEAVLRPSTDTGDSSSFFTASATTTDRITSFVSGGFTLGGERSETNANGGSYIYAVWNDAEYAATGELFSSSIDTASYPTILNRNLLRARWSQNVPSGCTLEVRFRGGALSPPTDVDWTDFYSGSGSIVTQDLTGVGDSLRGKRYYQYHVNMESCTSSGETPTLYDIQLDFD